MTRKIKYIIPFVSVLFMGAAFQYGGLKLDITTQLTSVSPVVLNSASTQIQRFTGSTAQVVKLPNATTLRSGYFYTIYNNSTANLTVSTFSSTAITTVPIGQWNTFVLTSNATTGGPWTSESSGLSGLFTQGSVPFADTTGLLTQDNADLFWDNTYMQQEEELHKQLNKKISKREEESEKNFQEMVKRHKEYDKQFKEKSDKQYEGTENIILNNIKYYYTNEFENII